MLEPRHSHLVETTGAEQKLTDTDLLPEEEQQFASWYAFFNAPHVVAFTIGTMTAIITANDFILGRHLVGRSSS